MIVLRTVFVLVIALGAPAVAQEPDMAAPSVDEVAPDVVPERAPVAAPPTLDAQIAERLRTVFEAVPVFAQVEVEVQAGVVTLSGEAPSSEVHQEMLELTRATPGVVYVVDRVTGVTDVSRRLSPAIEAFRTRGHDFVLRVPLILLAATVLGVF